MSKLGKHIGNVFIGPQNYDSKPQLLYSSVYNPWKERKNLWATKKVPAYVAAGTWVYGPPKNLGATPEVEKLYRGVYEVKN